MDPGQRELRQSGAILTLQCLESLHTEILDLQENLEEIPTLYTIDLVDLDTCQNQLLLEDIKQYGREIYKKI